MTHSEDMPSAPAKGLREVTPLSQDARLRGRPRLCSDCGLCDSYLRPRMGQLCSFVHSQAATLEQWLHGRQRHLETDEAQFGVYQSMYAARLKLPVRGAQWSGMVTTLGARLLELDWVDGVITAATAPGTRFAPWPILACTPAEIRACAGNKPCLSPNLRLLDTVLERGIKRLAVIGTSCQVQMLRAAEASLGLEQLYVIGIPCSDNVTYPDLQFFLTQVSRSPETLVHYEFMQDFSLWMRHENGHVERRNFIDFPMDKLEGIFPSACLACFDYPNALADITIGYMGAPLGWQWVLVRTPHGQALFDLLAPELEFSGLFSRGNRRRGMGAFIRMLGKPPRKPPAPVRKFIAYLQRRRGPQGLEFARAVIEMKLLRNLHYVRTQFPRHQARIVPEYVYQTLEPYAADYKQVFGQSLRPALDD